MDARTTICKQRSLWDAFLSGQGPRRVFVFYQPRDSKTDSGEWVVGKGPREIFATLGDEERIRDHACFFLRTSEAAIDPEKVMAAGSVRSLLRKRGKHVLCVPDPVCSPQTVRS